MPLPAGLSTIARLSRWRCLASLLIVTLGVMGFESWGVSGVSAQTTSFDDKAISQLRKAAEQGNAEAQVNLGNAYYFGRDVPKDDTGGV